MKARLILEDGTVYSGASFGAKIESTGEVVFNTSMSGYQEILTDPSYTGQIVTMTYPHIGNYGVNEDDMESKKPYLSGYVVKELCREPSNHRSQETLDSFLERWNVPGIEGIDTRALTKRIRTAGAMRGIITTSEEPLDVLLRRVKSSPSMLGADLASTVTTKKAWTSGEPVMKMHVAALDFGIKFNIVNELTKRGARVTVLPADTSPEELLRLKPDGIFLSNGPGDPAAVGYAVENIRSLLGEVPIFGICLGHQLLSLALGAKTFKLKFGHRGGNHPVKNNHTGKIEISVQNHGFAVDPASVDESAVEITHLNLNDGTVEGIAHWRQPAFSVQYHPESSPGPHDSRYLFDDFFRMMKTGKPLQGTRG